MFEDTGGDVSATLVEPPADNLEPEERDERSEESSELAENPYRDFDPGRKRREDGNEANTLGPRVALCAAAWARGWTATEVAQTFDVPKRSLYRWIRNPAFQAEVARLLAHRASVRSALLAVLEPGSKATPYTRFEAAKLLLELDRPVLPDRSLGHKLFDPWVGQDALAYYRSL